MTEDGAGEGGGDASAAPTLSDVVPDVVRRRVLALAAEALPGIAAENLPPALRRVAGFAPSRRAKLAGGLIASHLESDEDFRERVATQLQASLGDTARVVSEREGSAADPADPVDPVEVAAAAYLLRPEGWEQYVAGMSDRIDADRRDGDERRGAEQLAKVRRRLEEAEADLREQRRRGKEQADRLKQENADLRRKLGDTRTRLRQAEELVDTQTTDLTTRLDAAEKALGAADAEARRLRSRLAQAEEEAAATRRTGRANRVGETVRAKLLVDTLVEAAGGLKRELGLPATEDLPADTVVGRGGENEAARLSSGRRSLPVGDPALLEELLRLPRPHLVIDGYNVTKNTWPDLPLEKQRERLLTAAAALQARTRAEITVVFDAAETQDRPPVSPPRGVRVLFSPFGVIADDVIRDLVAAEPRGRAVAVVSSDQEVARDVEKAGFRVVASSALSGALRVSGT